MPVLTPQQQKDYYASQGSAKKPLSPLDWLKVQTPTNTKEETPASDLPTLMEKEPTGGETQTTGDLGNLRLALRSALNEAAQTTAKNRITALSGLMEGGVAPSVLSAAVGLAQSGLKQSQESIFSDAIAGYTEEQKARETKKTSALNMINTIIDNGVFPDTPAGTLLAWEKEAGLPEGTALAWQARLKIAQDKSEEKGNLELQLLRKEIADKSVSEGPSSFTDIMQEVIDKDGTPEQAAREAAAVSEGQGISVDQKTLSAWRNQAKNLKKTVAVLSETLPSKIEQDITSMGNFFDAGMKREQLRKKGYTQAEIASSSVGNIIEKTTSAATSVGSFFSSLFGGL